MLLALSMPSIGQTQEIDSSRGADPTLDYDAFVEIGPWDDRNYQLTAKDLEVLAENESDLRDPIPVFYRVLLRRANPSLQTSGPAQYPRSALPSFFQLCGGYLINGRYYRSATIKDGRFKVMIDSEDHKGVAAPVRPECELRKDKDDT
jgi:hypothetical protein